MKKTVLFLSIIVASGLTMVTAYQTVIDSRSWSSDIPASIQAAREYYKHVDPRLFFALIGPPNFLLSLMTIILFWRNGVGIRIYLAGSLVCYAAILALTFAYFLPRDLILFTSPISDHIEEIRKAASQWSQLNWLRTFLGLAGVWFSCKGLDTYYRRQGPTR